jgi:hypothetical protein
MVFPNFIPKTKAQHIIDIARSRMAPSGLAWRADETPDPDQQTRTSTGVFLSRCVGPPAVRSPSGFIPGCLDLYELPGTMFCPTSC